MNPILKCFSVYTRASFQSRSVDLLTGSRGDNQYNSLSLECDCNLLPICLLSKASKTKSGYLASTTGSPSSTTVDQDAPSPSNSPTTQGTQTPIISHDVEEDNHDIEVAHMGN
ncbi:hypothetical protein Tco_0382024 [Tanacetum coccineum]